VALIMTLLAVLGALSGAAFLLWLTFTVEARQLGPVTLPEVLKVAEPVPEAVRTA
jgi:hypothetical protein